MAASDMAGQAADNFITVKVTGNMAHGTMRMEMRSIPARDSRRFLTPVLKRMKPKRNKGCASVSTANPKNPAFFAEFIVVKRMCCQHESA